MKEEKQKNNPAIVHITFKGEYVDEGMMDILTLAESLKTFNSVFEYFKKEQGISEDFVIRMEDIKKSSSDIVINIQLVQEMVSLAKDIAPYAGALTGTLIADK